MDVPVSIRLESEIEERLVSLAKATGRSKAQLIRQCIEDRLEDLEDIYISLRRLEKGEKSHSLDSVKKEILDS